MRLIAEELQVCCGLAAEAKFSLVRYTTHTQMARMPKAHRRVEVLCGTNMALIFPKACYSSCALEATLCDEDNKPTMKAHLHLSTDIPNLPVR